MSLSCQFEFMSLILCLSAYFVDLTFWKFHFFVCFCALVKPAGLLHILSPQVRLFTFISFLKQRASDFWISVFLHIGFLDVLLVTWFSKQGCIFPFHSIQFSINCWLLFIFFSLKFATMTDVLGFAMTFTRTAIKSNSTYASMRIKYDEEVSVTRILRDREILEFAVGEPKWYYFITLVQCKVIAAQKYRGLRGLSSFGKHNNFLKNKFKDLCWPSGLITFSNF